MKIWITGIAGFLGSHLAEALGKEGHEVFGNDNMLTGDACNVPNNVHYWVNIDCCDKRLHDEMKRIRPDIVVHCAAIAAEGFSLFSPHLVTRNIFEASVNTFSAAIASGCKRIVHMTSMARYGRGLVDSEEGLVHYKPYAVSSGEYRMPADWVGPPFKEDVHLTAPVDPYGIAKVAAEQTLAVLCKTHGVKWTIAVPHNIIGTRQQVTPYRNVVSIFLNRLHFGTPVYIYGDGNQQRCFSPVRDCINSIVRMVNGDADGEIVNIGPDGGEMTINTLLDICEEVTGKKAERVYLDPRPVTDDVKLAYCSADKARDMLGYKPQQSIKDCIAEMWHYFKPVPFDYNFPVEIQSVKLPKTWKEKL